MPRADRLDLPAFDERFRVQQVDCTAGKGHCKDFRKRAPESCHLPVGWEVNWRKPVPGPAD